MKLFIPIILSLITAFALPPKKKIKIWLIGDSTMSVKDVKAYPETGWGMPFAYFWDSTVTVDNRAMNGRSTRTFRTKWAKQLTDNETKEYTIENIFATLNATVLQDANWFLYIRTKPFEGPIDKK